MHGPRGCWWWPIVRSGGWQRVGVWLRVAEGRGVGDSGCGCRCRRRRDCGEGGRGDGIILMVDAL